MCALCAHVWQPAVGRRHPCSDVLGPAVNEHTVPPCVKWGARVSGECGLPDSKESHPSFLQRNIFPHQLPEAPKPTFRKSFGLTHVLTNKYPSKSSISCFPGHQHRTTMSAKAFPEIQWLVEDKDSEDVMEKMLEFDLG